MLVQSRVSSADEREQIRSTWGEECRKMPDCDFSFVVGKTDSKEEGATMEDEARRRGDILQVREHWEKLIN